jgi:hypothetical protein
MLSYQRMAAPHRGHDEPGDTIERPAGRRAMTTLRKLPIAPPTASTQAATAR